MADFEAPTFSLGFDSGGESDSKPQLQELDLQVPDSDPEPEKSDPPRVLKRLKRGTSFGSTLSQEEEPINKGDDDIEEFSSQEDDPFLDEPLSAQHYTLCSSSKFPQHRSLPFQLASQSKLRKTKQVLQASVSASSEACIDKVVFPKLTISPLRRFQLIDSDSDDLPEKGKMPTVSKKMNASSKEKQSTPVYIASTNDWRRTKASASMPQNEDLWKDFSPIKSVHIPTPFLDEVCEEYFQTLRKTNVAHTVRNDASASSNSDFYEKNDTNQYVEHQLDSNDPLPPAHRYFFHDDPRIQKLVRSRLPNFRLLGAVDITGNEWHSVSVIDYRNQFSHGEASRKQANRNNIVERGSTKVRKNSKKSKVEEASHASGAWVNPRSGPSVPKDAGKRRVTADVHSSGHWFTAADGKRVYVNKSGQELTGRIAYRNYRKEREGGFRKMAKEKTRAKKK